MSAFSDATAVAMKGLAAQAQRLRVVSENIANTDTPGYRRKLISFDDAMTASNRSDPEWRIDLDPRDPEQIFDPGHPLAGDDGYYAASNVDLLIEIADAREAQRSYEANLKMFDQTRQMSSGLLDLLRR